MFLGTSLPHVAQAFSSNCVTVAHVPPSKLKLLKMLSALPGTPVPLRPHCARELSRLQVGRSKTASPKHSATFWVLDVYHLDYSASGDQKESMEEHKLFSCCISRCLSSSTANPSNSITTATLEQFCMVGIGMLATSLLVLVVSMSLLSDCYLVLCRAI